MSTTLTLTAKASVSWSYQNVDSTAGNTDFTSSFSYSQAYTDGTTANKVDRLYVSTGTVAASGNTTFDLAGSLTNAFGSTLTFARIKVFYFENTTDTSASGVTVGNGSTPWLTWVGGATHTVTVRNGGCLLLSAPDATAFGVTAATGDVLKIANQDSSNTLTYRIVFAGCSA